MRFEAGKSASEKTYIPAEIKKEGGPKVTTLFKGVITIEPPVFMVG